MIADFCKFVTQNTNTFYGSFYTVYLDNIVKKEIASLSSFKLNHLASIAICLRDVKLEIYEEFYNALLKLFNETRDFSFLTMDNISDLVNALFKKKNSINGNVTVPESQFSPISMVFLKSSIFKYIDCKEMKINNLESICNSFKLLDGPSRNEMMENIFDYLAQN